MTAISHHIEIPPPSPTADVEDLQDHFYLPSRMDQRRAEVRHAVEEIVEAAEAAGWTITQRRTFSKKCSIYIDCHLINGVAVTIRVSNHAPSRPLGLRADRPTVLVLVGFPGGISHATAWLQRTAEEVRVVREGGRCKARLRGAV